MDDLNDFTHKYKFNTFKSAKIFYLKPNPSKILISTATLSWLLPRRPHLPNYPNQNSPRILLAG